MEKNSPSFAFNVLRVFDSVFFVEEGINIDNQQIKLNYGLGLYSKIEESSVQFVVRADFSSDDKIFATNTVVTKFGINDLKAFTDEKGGIKWPLNSLETMFGIAFSHLRALMAKNMAGSRFSFLILPLINQIEVFNSLMQDNPDFKPMEVTDE